MSEYSKHTGEQSFTVLNVSDSPHAKSNCFIKDVMLNIIISMIPIIILGIYAYGTRVLTILTVSCLAAFLCELIWCRVFGKGNSTKDLSCVCTGMMLCCVYNPSVPLWIPLIGSFLAVIVFKQLFGGIGKGLINPVAATMLVLYSVFPGQMLNTVKNNTYLPALDISVKTADIVSSASPLAQLKAGEASAYSYSDLILGNVSSAIGCLSALLIVASAVYMIIKHTISLAVPFGIIASTAVLTYVFPVSQGSLESMLTQTLSGTLLFSAFFIAGDFSSTPITVFGKTIYSVSCGIITVLIRYFGNVTEGIFFAICITNLFVPLIDRITINAPKTRFGVLKSNIKHR